MFLPFYYCQETIQNNFKPCTDLTNSAAVYLLQHSENTQSAGTAVRRPPGFQLWLQEPRFFLNFRCCFFSTEQGLRWSPSVRSVLHWGKDYLGTQHRVFWTMEACQTEVAASKHLLQPSCSLAVEVSVLVLNLNKGIIRATGGLTERAIW